ncbi:oxidoreductase [Pseudooceanicola marinus]|nr:molybdopterin-dependent oxidoreductase [Pseudooceanicola marinus]PJE26352.1 oxidoreductase [Pseudooceanicola marinus]
MRPTKILQIATVLASTLLWSASAQAADDTVLSVTTSDTKVAYTLEDLRVLPVTVIETSTIWTEGPQRFTGVSLHDFMTEQGIAEGTIRATAINDYSVEIPMSDATQGGPIIAYERNGEEMSRRGKGPLWIVYPYDSDPKFQTETYFSRSIWQLDRLTVE